MGDDAFGRIAPLATIGRVRGPARNRWTASRPVSMIGTDGKTRRRRFQSGDSINGSGHDSRCLSVWVGSLAFRR